MADKPDLHGRDHRPGGADPIPGLTTATGIQYNILNDGEWLYVQTSGPTGDGPDYGMGLRDNSGDGMELYSTSRTHLYSGTTLDIDSGSVDLHSVGNIAFDSDASIALTANGDVSIVADGEFTFTAAGSGVTTITSEGPFNVGSDDSSATYNAKEVVSIASATSYTEVVLPALVGTASDYSFAVGVGGKAGACFRVDNDGTVHTAGPVVEDL